MNADSWDPGQYAKFLRERSAPFAGPGLRFEKGTAEPFVPDAPFDLVFANAAFHFVEGHEALWPRPGPDLYERFLETYRRRLLPCLVDERPYFFTFRRVLMHAAK